MHVPAAPITPSPSERLQLPDAPADYCAVLEALVAEMDRYYYASGSWDALVEALGAAKAALGQPTTA